MPHKFHLYLIVITFRFGIINAIKTGVPISKGEEFTLAYGYNFDEAPLWYKDLFLKFMTKYPQHTEAIKFVSEGRSKMELMAAYDEYMNDDSIAKYEAYKVVKISTLSGGQQM